MSTKTFLRCDGKGCQHEFALETLNASVKQTRAVAREKHHWRAIRSESGIVIDFCEPCLAGPSITTKP